MGDLIDLNSIISASRIDPAVTLDTEYIAADTAHINATDPHLQYATQARGDARYRQLNTQTFTPTVKVIGTSTGNVATTDASQINQSGHEVQASNATSAAYLSFHRPGLYGVHFGLNTKNKLTIGGWSLGNNEYKVFHEGEAVLVKAPLPTALEGANSFALSWNSVQPGSGIAELCNFAGLGTGDAFNFFRQPGIDNVSPTISNRILRIDQVGAITQTSDKRVKSDFTPAPGLSVLLALIPQSYNHWVCEGFDEKTKALKLGKVYIPSAGFVAQEVQKVFPEAVSLAESDAELLGIRYNMILACAVKAIQELEAQVQELRLQVAAIPKK